MTILPRSGWHAAPPRSTVPYSDTKQWVDIHWTVSPSAASANRTGIDRAILGIQSYHMQVRNWSDIAYNFMVDQNGDVWEARGWHNTNGAHKRKSANRYDIAVCTILGPGEHPTSAMLNSLRGFIAEARSRGWRTGVRGHREADGNLNPGKVCPGPDLEHWINTRAWEGPIMPVQWTQPGDPITVQSTLEDARAVWRYQGGDPAVALLTAIGDPGVQRAVAYLLNIAMLHHDRLVELEAQ